MRSIRSKCFTKSGLHTTYTHPTTSFNNSDHRAASLFCAISPIIGDSRIVFPFIAWLILINWWRSKCSYLVYSSGKILQMLNTDCLVVVHWCRLPNTLSQKVKSSKAQKPETSAFCLLKSHLHTRHLQRFFNSSLIKLIFFWIFGTAYWWQS